MQNTSDPFAEMIRDALHDGDRIDLWFMSRATKQAWETAGSDFAKLPVELHEMSYGEIAGVRLDDD